MASDNEQAISKATIRFTKLCPVCKGSLRGYCVNCNSTGLVCKHCSKYSNKADGMHSKKFVCSNRYHSLNTAGVVVRIVKAIVLWSPRVESP